MTLTRGEEAGFKAFQQLYDKGYAAGLEEGLALGIARAKTGKAVEDDAVQVVEGRAGGSRRSSEEGEGGDPGSSAEGCA